MNRIFKTTICALALALTAQTFTACNKDDDDDKSKDVPETSAAVSFDDLAYFQSAFVSTDTLGNFVSHLLGEPLYSDDTAHLYIGVETVEEALKYFESGLAPDITRTTSAANNYTYSLTAADGQPQGSVTFAPGGEGGAVAEITTDAKNLKYFNKVTFIANSAWPHNSSKGKYRLGDIVPMTVNVGEWPFDEDTQVKFVCVRESGNGAMPIFVAITKEAYLAAGFSGAAKLIRTYGPDPSTAKTISELLRTDLEFYKACFEEAGEGLLTTSDTYWINERVDKVVYRDQACITLGTGDVDYWDITWHSPKKYVLMKIDGFTAWLLDMQP